MIVSASKTAQTLRRIIEEDNIPQYLGGPLSIFGDAECRSVISPGGPMPPGLPECVSELILKPTQVADAHPPRLLGAALAGGSAIDARNAKQKVGSMLVLKPSSAACPRASAEASH